MNKSLAIAVCLSLVAVSVCDVEAGIFGRRSGRCSGGNCYRSSTPRYQYTPTYSQSRTVTQPVVNQEAPQSSKKVTTAKAVAQPANGNAADSPSDIPVEQAAPATSAAQGSRVIHSSPCAGGNCRVRTYRSPCAGGRCSTRSYRRGWFRSR